MMSMSKPSGLFSRQFGKLFLKNPSWSYRASPAIWDHAVLPATQCRWTCPTLTPARQADTRFTYPGGIEGWNDFDVGYIPRRFTCVQTLIQLVIIS